MTAFIVDRFGQRRVAQPGEILQDGERMSFSIMALDAVQRAVAASRLDDGSGHRPGFRSNILARDAALEAYDARDRWLADAWRGPAPAPKRSTVTDARAEYERWLGDAWRAA